ncbi:hypothetical protein [Streptomyces avermitilis]|uniref:hypothetical protein n=1 Tax=Streptomyces avermitilis TaxID=33903 RepID=UPI00380D6475
MWAYRRAVFADPGRAVGDAQGGPATAAEYVSDVRHLLPESGLFIVAEYFLAT